ncbi:multiheme c-type cytochrome [Thalassoglobus sp.]|uniref:multiheme c-type cytochrome n=1 Tax=Thalassoglobus sp. TaxID=2795869 RepID=UPI003AA85191
MKKDGSASTFDRMKIASVVILCLLTGCGPTAPKEASQATAPGSTEPELTITPPKPRPAPSQGYLGSQACVECHTETHEHYSQHPMGQSLAKVLEATPIENYEGEDRFSADSAPGSNLRLAYEVEKTDDEVIHREILERRNGEQIYSRDVPVQYAIGAGVRGRSYLINHDGFLFMSPVTWYSQSGTWDLSPAYHIRNMQFGRRIVDDCLSCHAGRVATASDTPDSYQPNPFIEESIGCERCHGPGEQHVQFHHGKIELPKDPIVNPIDLPPRKRDHVCMQCHLGGESRLTRYDRSDFDFRPGDDLADIWTVFIQDNDHENGTRSDKGHRHASKVVSQAEQMFVSRCYQKSNGKLGCISCHDPHTVPSADEKVSFYKSKCLECHSPGNVECSQPVSERLLVSSEDSCIQCHMPVATSSNISHVAQSDHRVLREYPPERSHQHEADEEQAVMVVVGEKENLIPKDELDRAKAIMQVRISESIKAPELAGRTISFLEKWVEAVPSDIEAALTLGIALQLQQAYTPAIQAWQKALEVQPENELLLRRLMFIHLETGQPAISVDYSQRLVNVVPWDAEYFGFHAQILAELRRFDEAVSAAKRSLELNPGQPQIHQLLAKLYAVQNNSEQSQLHEKQAQQMSR